MITNLSLEEKIGQMFMIGFSGTELPARVERFISENNIGGVILFSRNIKSIKQVINLNNKIHSLSKTGPMIWTDQEGGNIVRFDEMAATGISHMGIAATKNIENARTIASLIAKDMKKLGVDGIFAPVLDVNINEKNPVIGIRSFSKDPEKVVKYAREFVRGLKSENIANCGKHFPGHGAASSDSHLVIPEITLSRKMFEAQSLFPFLKLSDNLDAIMTAHVKYTHISDSIGTFSQSLISDRLKKGQGFEGIVFSDCLEMKAITENYTAEEIVLNCINAGIDVMTVSHTYFLQKKLYGIAFNLAKKGVISEKRINDSVKRILKLKGKYRIEKTRYTPQNLFPTIRQDIDIERKIAYDSIDILKSEKNSLPIKKDSRILFIEFSKAIKGPAVLSKKNISKFDKTIKTFFSNYDVLKINLSLDPEIIQKVKHPAGDFKHIIIFIYSFTGETKKIVQKFIKKLFSEGDDIILISLENPYEINDFKFIKTFICSYGFREIQMESVLKTLLSDQKESPQIHENA